MMGSLDHVERRLIVHTSPTKRSSDFIVHLQQFDRLYGPKPGRATKPVVLVEDNGPIHVSKLTKTALAARSHWLGLNVENRVLAGTTSINGTGNAQDNSLIGNAGSNVLNGADGNDRLEGFAGVDTLTGGVGADTFVFRTGYGRDVFTDLVAGSAGTDVIELGLGTAFDTFAEVMAATVQGTGVNAGNTIITFNAADSITLQNVQKSALIAADFHFVV
jgi:Ca2+-binding RTX toxin-like protein